MKNPQSPQYPQNGRRVTEAEIALLERRLKDEERADATVEKYLRDARAFAAWLDGRPATLDRAIAYKRGLAAARKAAGVNAALAALNKLFACLGWGDITLRPLRVQRAAFSDSGRVLTKGEYGRLVRAAEESGDARTGLAMQAICSTGIRVSELRFITKASLAEGRAEITNKGKTRTVFLPGKLCRALGKYVKAQGIAEGPVFVTKGGRPLDRRNIWAAMKRLCARAGVAPGKVFPHALRTLFAHTFYGAAKDIARLADILGHSSINTTRRYILDSVASHRTRIDALGLVNGNMT
ncbi:MAG: tyrosine-type recombinase/integrase [Clostridiales Family XIII bacterium]|nr:tyrosine-type recombinase/integrase [Clostridiales Family XIII bacterium]